MTELGGLVSEARRIGEETAGVWAGQVDRDARFPVETVTALRISGLLGAMVPSGLGGIGASVEDMSQAVATIGSYCASSALVLAMHQIQVASIVRHGSPALQNSVLPRVATGELLLANANSEVGLGGNRRSSLCALEVTPTGFHLEKQAATVSYGEFADGILATARRTADSPDNEQVLVVCLQPDMSLKPSGVWDTLGLRGTCSRPGQLIADVSADMVIDDNATVFARTSLPVSVVLLSSVWLGIAEGAARQAHAYLRAQARKIRESAAPASSPPLGTLRLAELSVILQQMRDGLAAGAADYERAKDTPDVETLRFSSRMDNIKLSASTLVLDVVLRAMAICGLSGYMNHTPFSMARTVRDAVAAPLMVSNDRALSAAAQTLLVRKEL